MARCSQGGAYERNALRWQFDPPPASHQAGIRSPSAWSAQASPIPDRPHVQARRRCCPRGSNAMRAFKSSPPRWLRAILVLCAVNLVLCSFVATTAFARTRPPVDMGDPDPTEGPNPTLKASPITSPYLTRDGHSAKYGISERRRLADYILVWRWINLW